VCYPPEGLSQLAASLPLQKLCNFRPRYFYQLAVTPPVLRRQLELEVRNFQNLHLRQRSGQFFGDIFKLHEKLILQFANFIAGNAHHGVNFAELEFVRVIELRVCVCGGVWACGEECEDGGGGFAGLF
jgi:hypothetical protein